MFESSRRSGPVLLLTEQQAAEEPKTTTTTTSLRSGRPCPQITSLNKIPQERKKPEQKTILRLAHETYKAFPTAMDRPRVSNLSSDAT